MTIYAIGDPHLGLAVSKPMDKFGLLWSGHPVRLFQTWEATVAPDDVVLVPGDISWAMTLDEALPDLEELDKLPGQKLLIPGNHDYWWESISKIRTLGLKTMQFIQNDAVLLAPGAVAGIDEPVAVCGTRGWITPKDRTWHQDEVHNQKIYQREVGRLRNSLMAGQRLGATRYIVMLHYPPVAEDHQVTEFTTLLESFGGVIACVYGHLHGSTAQLRAYRGQHADITYRLVSCDSIDFTPVPLFSTTGSPGLTT